jgi:APA family basic amino acid/polyamine antiporter
MAAVAGFTPIRAVAELVNIGTLAAFVVVCGGVILMRRSHPDMHRPFRAPLSPLTPLLGIVFCLYLIANLAPLTWLRFVVWMIIGLAVYFAYSRRRSALAVEGAAVGD